MDYPLFNRISEILLQVESSSYARRVAVVVLLVFVAFLFNALLGRLLEKIRQMALRRMVFVAGAGQEGEVVFGLDMAFGLANLTCTALLAWQVHHICTWILQTDGEPS